MKVVQNVVPFIVFFTLIVPLCFTEHKNRLRRRVVFVKDSKFFVRINGYEPLLRWSTVFGHAWGFKTSWNLPTTLSSRRNFFKRSLESHYALLKDPIRNNYYDCILWVTCYRIRSVLSQNSCGMICQLYRIIESYGSFNLSTFADTCDIDPESCHQAENFIL